MVCDIQNKKFQIQDWIKEIEKTRKPLYILFNKSDTDTEDKKFKSSLENVNYDLFIGFTLFSSKTLKNGDEFFLKISTVFIVEPLNEIYDFEKKELTTKADLALRRIFWTLDEDFDGVLGKDEVKHIKYAKIGTNLQDFLDLHKSLIQDQKSGDVWKLLKTFKYNSFVELDFEDLM